MHLAYKYCPISWTFALGRWSVCQLDMWRHCYRRQHDDKCRGRHRHASKNVQGPSQTITTERKLIQMRKINKVIYFLPGLSSCSNGLIVIRYSYFQKFKRNIRKYLPDQKPSWWLIKSNIPRAERAIIICLQLTPMYAWSSHCKKSMKRIHICNDFQWFPQAAFKALSSSGWWFLCMCLMKWLIFLGNCSRLPPPHTVEFFFTPTPPPMCTHIHVMAVTVSGYFDSKDYT